MSIFLGGGRKDQPEMFCASAHFRTEKFFAKNWLFGLFCVFAGNFAKRNKMQSFKVKACRMKKKTILFFCTKPATKSVTQPFVVTEFNLSSLIALDQFAVTLGGLMTELKNIRPASDFKSYNKTYY